MTPEELKIVRENRNLTQAEIADELEISERFWHYRERGIMKIPRWLARAVRDLGAIRRRP